MLVRSDATSIVVTFDCIIRSPLRKIMWNIVSQISQRFVFHVQITVFNKISAGADTDLTLPFKTLLYNMESSYGHESPQRAAIFCGPSVQELARKPGDNPLVLDQTYDQVRVVINVQLLKCERSTKPGTQVNNFACVSLNRVEYWING